MFFTFLNWMLVLSKDLFTFAQQRQKSPDGGIGRRAGLKHQWSNIHPGSTPGLGTSKSAKQLEASLADFFVLQFLKIL